MKTKTRKNKGYTMSRKARDQRRNAAKKASPLHMVNTHISEVNRDWCKMKFGSPNLALDALREIFENGSRN